MGSQRSKDALTVSDGQFTFRNEHFRDLSNRDEKDKISGTFIFDGLSAQGASGSVNTGDSGSQPKVKKGENVIGKHPMDKQQDTAISAGTWHTFYFGQF